MIRRTLLAAALLACPASPAAAQSVAARNVELKSHWNEYPSAPSGQNAYSACWSYVHGDGREYAVIGTRDGTAIYNVTDPAASYRVGFVPGPSCTWREMKSYRQWIYVVSECAVGPDPGLQIVSMIDPENPVLVATYTATFDRAHTVSVDTTRALLVANGTRTVSGERAGMRLLSLATPTAPIELSWWPGGGAPPEDFHYVHDSVPVGNRLYASSILAGYQRILDVTNPAAPTEVHGWTYPGAFTHNAWPDASGDYLYVTDEVNGEPLKVFDISTPTSPVLVNTLTSNPLAIVHNAHVAGDELFLSNYTEGIRVLDLSDPAHPAEFAWADSWAGGSGGFRSVWGVCPYFPSGTVIASDMQTGLYVYRVQRTYGLITARVTDGIGGPPIAGARVRLVEQGDSLWTPASGIARFAPSPGTHTVVVDRFGWESAQAAVNVTVGSDDTLAFALVARPDADLAGTVVDHGTAAGLDDAEVSLRYTAVHAHTDGAGGFLLDDVPADVYRVDVARPGYVPVSFVRALEPPGDTQTIPMVAAPLWDDLETDTGWTVGAPEDDAQTGVWERVEPLGTGAPDGPLRPATRDGRRGRLSPDAHGDGEDHGLVPGDVQPETDRTPGAGQLCFVTGQGTDPNAVGENDVDRGRTSLTSPALDLTGFADPRIAVWRWFYSTGNEEDWLAILLSNDDGATWAAVDTVRRRENRWTQQVIRVTDLLPATSQMRVRFVAADNAPGNIVEAAVDDLIAYDGATPLVAIEPPPSPARLAFRAARPNPSRGPVALTLAVAGEAPIRVSIHDLRGRRVADLYRGRPAGGELVLAWDGRDAAGAILPAGIYHAVASDGRRHAVSRLVRLP